MNTTATKMWWLFQLLIHFHCAVFNRGINKGHALTECEYSDGRTLFCESCCEFDCCEGGGGLSGHAIGGIVGGSAILFFAISCIGICFRWRTHQQRRRAATVVTVPRSAGVTNPHHAGYDQIRIQTIHQPNPNQSRLSGNQVTNADHTGYDQQVPSFEPIPPPPYVTKQTQK